MKLPKIIKLLPLIIILIAAVVMLITVATTDISLVKYHYVGLVLLAGALTAQFINEKIGYQITGLLLLIGTFTFAAFTSSISTFGIRFGSVDIQFDVLCLPVFIIYLFVHRHELEGWIKELIKS